MKTRVSQALFACVAVLGVSMPWAGEPGASGPGASETVQPLAWLKSRNYATLEEYYSQQQRDYEAGRTSDEVLYAAFRRLYEDSPDNSGYFDRWMQAYPRSYSAVLARGAYLYRMAWAVRGEKYINQTAPQQLDSMSNWLARAQPDLMASMKLTAKSYLSTLYLFNIAMLNGSKAEREHWYELGTAMDPANTLLRYRYMFSLRPRWGGSYAQMQAFLQECEAQHFPPAFLARLEMLIHADLAEDAMSASNESQMFDEWAQVLKLAGVAGEAPSTEALIGYTRAAQDINQPAAAARGLQQLADRKVEDAWSLAQLGWIYARAHRDSEAWPLLQKAAELNDRWAQFVFGHETYKGVPALHKAPDHAEGLIWIRRSAQQCFAEAVSFLQAHGESQPACNQGAPRTRAWLEALVRYGGSGFLISLIGAWMAASRKRQRVPAEAGYLRQPTSTLAIGLAGALFFLGLAVLSMAYDNGTTGPLVTGGFFGFAALSLWIVAEYYRCRYRLTADGMIYGRVLSGRGSMTWRDVTRVTYSPVMKWFCLETASGQVVRVSAMLTGLPDFAREVLAKVPSYAIADGALAVLQSTGRGELPSPGT